MRLVYVTDTHWKTKRPTCRVDENYFSSVLTDLEFMLEYCSRNNIQAVLHAGDVFDSPDVAKNAATALRAVTAIVTLLKKHGVHIYTVLGQHDTYARSTSEWEAGSGLKMLVEAGVATVVSSEMPPLRLSDSVVLAGCGYDDPLLDKYLYGDESYRKNGDYKNDILVQMFHASVGYAGQASIDIRDISPDVDVALFGDIHNFVCMEELKNGAVAIAAGAFSQLRKEDLDRRIGFWDLQLGENCEATFIEVPYVTQGRMDEEAIARGDKTKLEALAASIKRAESVQGETHPEMATRIAEAANIRKESLNLVLSLLN